jgi:23S rRNA (adenine1618-N6)-methyltransferase
VNTPHRSKKSPAKPVRKSLHPRNLHNQGYDFSALIKSHPALAPYVKPSAHGNLSIDFADPLAVKTLNAALLKLDYKIVDWDIPPLSA